MVGDILIGGLTGYGLNTARARRNGHFGHDLDEADFASRAHMGAAAEFATVASDIDDADDVAIFIAKKGEGVSRFLLKFSLVGFDL